MRETAIVLFSGNSDRGPIVILDFPDVVTPKRNMLLRSNVDPKLAWKIFSLSLPVNINISKVLVSKVYEGDWLFDCVLTPIDHSHKIEVGDRLIFDF